MSAPAARHNIEICAITKLSYQSMTLLHKNATGMTSHLNIAVL